MTVNSTQLSPLSNHTQGTHHHRWLSKGTDLTASHDEIELMTGFAYAAQLFPPVQRELQHPKQISPGLVYTLNPIPDPRRRDSRLTRIARILDSLAQIAVSDHEVVAVAISYPSPSEITFQFASNQRVCLAHQLYIK